MTALEIAALLAVLLTVATGTLRLVVSVLMEVIRQPRRRR